jgi:hypothetical protein
MDTTRESVIINKRTVPVMTFPTQFATSPLHIESPGLESPPTGTDKAVEKRFEKSRDTRTKSPYFTEIELLMLRPTLSIVTTKTSSTQ